MPVYSYGATVLNDNVNLFLLEKPFDLVPFTQVLYKIARFEGMKKVGESVDQRQIDLKIKVVGSSRPDLENRLSALYQGLALRGQALTICATDSRYFVADAITAAPILISGSPISVLVPITFICQQPFAYSTTVSTFDTGQLTLTNVGTNLWGFPTQAVTGGGTIFSRPQIRVYQQGTALTWTSLTVVQQTDAYTLAMSTGYPSYPTINGDYIDFFCDPGGLGGFTIQKNGSGVALPYNGMFPVLEPTATSFAITVGAPSAPAARAVWTWTPRYLP